MMLLEPNTEDPVFFHMPYGIYTVNVDVAKDFSPADKEVLRGLAKRVAAAAAKPEQAEKARLWTRHNDLQDKRPVVFCDPEGGWNDIIPADAFLCQAPLARVWEMRLRKEVFWAEKMGDDKVVDDFFFVPYAYTTNSLGLPVERIGDNREGHAYHFKKQLVDFEKDFPKLRFPEITLQTEKGERIMSLAHDVFDGILKVRRRGVWWWSAGLTAEYIKWRGLEELMLDFYDNPDWVHKVMKFLSDSFLTYLDFLEKNRLLSSNQGNVYIGSGGFGWTDQLPENAHREGAAVSPMDMWGFSESQETVGVGEEFFREFILAYQLPILKRFGLNYYGCCEPLDKRMDSILTIPRLRRLSCSAWADLRAMSERLGDRYVMAVKPNPSLISRAHTREEDIRRDVRGILDSTRGSVVELVMKDNHTLGGDPENAVKWVRIAKEEAGRL